MHFVTLTPNLALDRTLQLTQVLVPGTLHRVLSVKEVAGGKGVNVARALKVLGADVTVTGFLGGFNGRKFRHLLAKEGLTGTFEQVAGETRECHILLSGSDGSDIDPHPTEVYEGGPAISWADWSKLAPRLPEGRLVISGSLAPGTDAEAFGELLAQLPQKPVVDTSGAALEVALEAGVALVKPNRAELAGLLPVKGDGITEAKLLYETYGVPILLSLGAGGAAHIADEVHVAPASAADVVNPVASGDCLLAAFLWARGEGWTVRKALCLGVAAGTENAVQGGGARITKAGVMARFCLSH